MCYRYLQPYLKTRVVNADFHTSGNSNYYIVVSIAKKKKGKKKDESSVHKPVMSRRLAYFFINARLRNRPPEVRCTDIRLAFDVHCA